MKSMRLLLFILLLSPFSSFALPKGGDVVQGNATLEQHGKQLLITQDSQSLQINFDEFNIADTEQVQFIQPSSDAVALNLVTGSQMSQLMGQLDANGQVFLINPNGVVVGNGAQIDVAGLLLSTQALSEQDLAQGKFIFSGQSQGQINNQGQINGHYYVALISPVIDNSGQINSHGNIHLLSAGQINVQVSPLTGLNISTEQAIEQGMLSNSGRLHSQGGKVVLSANAMGRLHQSVINNSGEIRATSLLEKNGEIILSAQGEGDIINTGLLEVENTGEISLSGSRIANVGAITADSTNGQAGHINIQASDSIVLAPNSMISASSTNNGNGGKINVIAQNSTRFMQDASIKANAGSQSGNGGVIEVSAYQQVEIAGLVETKASKGNSGEFLIDPYNVTISNTNAKGSFDASDPNIFTPSTTGSSIDVATLESNLNNTSVTITTTGGGNESGDILLAVDLNLDGSNGNTLSLIADGSIQVNGNIQDQNTNTSDNTHISLTAGGNIVISDGKQINVGGGVITLTAGGNATITGLISSNNTANAITVGVGGRLNSSGSVNAADISAPQGGLQLTTSAGLADINLNVAELSASNSDNSAMNITNNQALVIHNVNSQGALKISSNGELSLANNGSINNNGADINLSSTAAIRLGTNSTLSTNSNIDLHANDVLQVSEAGLTTTGSLKIQAASLQDPDSTIDISAQTLELTLSQPNSDLALNTQVEHLDVSLEAKGSLLINQAGNLDLQDLDGNGTAIKITQGNFILQLSQGNLSINNSVEANDNLADGIREGMIHLQLSGDLSMANNADSQLLAINTVDQSATGGLTGASSTTALYIQQLDNSEAGHSFNLGNNKLEIRAQGGDIVIDNQAQTQSALRPIILGSKTDIQAYNQTNDPSDGKLTMTAVTNLGASVSAHSLRQISLLAGPSELEEIIPGAIWVDASQEKISSEAGGNVSPTPQQSASDALFKAWFGDCVAEEGWENSCSRFKAIQYFLNRLLIGGALPK